jgi:putative Mn2+ efflux pump MntP
LVVLDLVIIAVALGLSNFAASIGIGLSGVDASLRWRLGVIFGIFEGGMPVVGLLLGRRLAESLGSPSPYLGGGLLIITGGYTIWQARREKVASQPVRSGIGPLVATGAALSIDNLVIGFALGTHNVSIVLAAIIIAAVSVGMSLLGLEVGARLGQSTDQWSGEIGGALLVLVGVAIAVGWF